MMTVAQLVEHLSSLPQDAFVLVPDTSGLVQDPMRCRDAATSVTLDVDDIRVAHLEAHDADIVTLGRVS